MPVSVCVHVHNCSSLARKWLSTLLSGARSEISQSCSRVPFWCGFVQNFLHVAKVNRTCFYGNYVNLYVYSQLHKLSIFGIYWLFGPSLHVCAHLETRPTWRWDPNKVCFWCWKETQIKIQFFIASALSLGSCIFADNFLSREECENKPLKNAASVVHAGSHHSHRNFALLVPCSQLWSATHLLSAWH